MIKNFFKIALRNLVNQKLYSFINIAGLAVGLACFGIIMTYVNFEYSYEDFNEKNDRIYRPVEIQQHKGVGTMHVGVTMGPLKEAAEQDIPEVEMATRFMNLGTHFTVHGDKKFFESGVATLDNNFFKIFSIDIINGEQENLLASPNQVVITQSIAEKFFGSEDPVGKSLTLEGWLERKSYQVSAVVADFPPNTHINFNIAVQFNSLVEQWGWLDSWHSNGMATYFLLRENATADAVNAKFPDFLEQYMDYENPEEYRLQMYLQPLREIHLESGHIRYGINENKGSIASVNILAVIGILILLIACINFMNLATARSAKRAREVGIRKVLGSYRTQLIAQFLSESFLISFIALGFALVIISLLMKPFLSLLDPRIPFTLFGDPGFIALLAGITIIVALLSGTYPSFALSAFKPVETLKGSFSRTGKGAALRKGLVLIQFSLAIALIAATSLIYTQIDYVLNKDLGFDKEQTVLLNIRDEYVRENKELLRERLLEQTEVSNVTFASNPTGASGSQSSFTTVNEEEPQTMLMRVSAIDFDFLNAMDIAVVEGRGLDKRITSDSTTSVLLNEIAVKEFGWDNPIGKEFRGGDDGNYQVIGIVRDYHYYPLQMKIEPQILGYEPSRFNTIFVKIRSADFPAAISSIENSWNAVLPDRPFEYTFLDEEIAKRYDKETNTAGLFSMFAGLSILIACLGLFGLSSFTTEQKTKEIGIRKTLGASIGSIISMLFSEFSKWILFASLIAFPAAWYFVTNWLTNFEYRTEINYFIFPAATLLVILIAFATVAFQSYKAATINPVDSLKYE